MAASTTYTSKLKEKETLAEGREADVRPIIPS